MLPGQMRFVVCMRKRVWGIWEDDIKALQGCYRAHRLGEPGGTGLLTLADFEDKWQDAGSVRRDVTHAGVMIYEGRRDGRH